MVILLLTDTCGRRGATSGVRKSGRRKPLEGRTPKRGASGRERTLRTRRLSSAKRRSEKRTVGGGRGRAATSDSLSVSHSPFLIQSLSIALRPHPSYPSYSAIHSRCAVSEIFPQGIKIGPVLFFSSSLCNLRPIERETALRV